MNWARWGCGNLTFYLQKNQASRKLLPTRANAALFSGMPTSLLSIIRLKWYQKLESNNLYGWHSLIKVDINVELLILPKVERNRSLRPTCPLYLLLRLREGTGYLAGLWTRVFNWNELTQFKFRYVPENLNDYEFPLSKGGLRGIFDVNILKFQLEKQ